MKKANSRSIKEHQSQQSKGGTRFEDQIYDDVCRIVDNNFEGLFEVIHYATRDEFLVDIRPVVVRELRLKSSKSSAKPDIAIRRLDTGRYVIFIGVKKSLRERHFGDDRHSMMLRAAVDPLVSNAKWIEIFTCEKDSDSREKIQRDRDARSVLDLAIDLMTSQFIDPAEFYKFILHVLREDLHVAQRAGSG